MKKHVYRTQSISELAVEPLRAQLGGQRLVVSIDVAKEAMVGALLSAKEQVYGLVHWSHPRQTPAFLSLIEQLQEWSLVDVVLEPSGSYGDPLRSALLARGASVYRVSPKRCHDAAEVYDGVPSLHDAKAALIIGWLHLDGASQRWQEATPEQRGLRAKIRTLTLYDDSFHRHLNRIEGQLGRYWPELTKHLELPSATLLALLRVHGSPAEVAAHADQAYRLMQRIGRGHLSQETIRQVIDSARTSVGMNCLAEERAYLRCLAEQADQARQAAQAAQQALVKAGLQQPGIQALAPVVGKCTAVILSCLLGPPAHYANAASYLKAMGLNLKERSSGQHRGRLMITKRGSGTVRRALYLATLRLIQRDPLVRQWYQRKVERDGGYQKMKAVVALMRKLGRALWYVGQGQPFEASKLCPP